MATDVEVRVREIICEQLGVSDGEISPEASFIEDLGADSLDIVELVMALEEEYEMEISDEDAENIKMVQDIIEYIESHRCAQKSFCCKRCRWCSRGRNACSLVKRLPRARDVERSMAVRIRSKTRV